MQVVNSYDFFLIYTFKEYLYCHAAMFASLCLITANYSLTPSWHVGVLVSTVASQLQHPKALMKICIWSPGDAQQFHGASYICNQ